MNEREGRERALLIATLALTQIGVGCIKEPGALRRARIVTARAIADQALAEIRAIVESRRP